MCGIFLYVSSDVSINTLIDAANQIKARGPDISTYVSLNNVFMCFHRLSINDLNLVGNQPMFFNNTALICNGEIYNYKKIKETYDFVTHSHSDCEVILHLYNHFKDIYGPDEIEEAAYQVCDKLDGEFAFVIYDVDLQKLIVGRDRYGVRPLFIGTDDKGGLGIASEMKSLTNLCTEHLDQFKPSFCSIINTIDVTDIRTIRYNTISEPYDPNNKDMDYILPKVKELLEDAVEKRLMSDVPIASLLSGGLDSSLVAAILAQTLGNEKLHTFSIGLKGATDLGYAQIVAEHIGSIHHEVIVTEDEMLAAIPEVVRVIESYDITTVRASTPHYLISKHISQKTPFKVLFSGEMSDEGGAAGGIGYLYGKLAPSANDYCEESNRLLEEIYRFDNLRADRAISANGLEARVPFSDHFLIKFGQSINPELRQSKGKIEKYILRKAFASSEMIPDEVLFRTKDAFSDGVSVKRRSWYEIIQEYVDTIISDEEFLAEAPKYEHNTPPNKEAYYYRKLFHQHYNHDKVIPHFWLPRWCDSYDSNGKIKPLDPSARTLNVYNDD